MGRGKSTRGRLSGLAVMALTSGMPVAGVRRPTGVSIAGHLRRSGPALRHGVAHPHRTYQPRDTKHSVLHAVIREGLDSFLREVSDGTFVRSEVSTKPGQAHQIGRMRGPQRGTAEHDGRESGDLGASTPLRHHEAPRPRLRRRASRSRPSDSDAEVAGRPLPHSLWTTFLRLS